MLINIATYVHIRKFETGNRTNLKRYISVCRYAYNEYKNIFDNISLVNNCNKYLIRFVKNIQHDRNINTIRLPVSINTGNRLHREPKQTITILKRNIMERRNDIPNLLAMYIRNTSEIYNITSRLQDCLIKKINNGVQPQLEYLANCSKMKSIIREAAKLLYKYDGITPTKQERQEAAREHAEYILECVQYSIQKRQ